MGVFFQDNRLIDMYIRRRNLANARKVFEKMPKRDVSSWNTMISGYVKCMRLEDARQLFDEMPIHGCKS